MDLSFWSLIIIQNGLRQNLSRQLQKIWALIFLENIVYRFEISQTIVSDNATIFKGDVLAFTSKLRITMAKSTPFYAQSNGQAEATNNVIK